LNTPSHFAAIKIDEFGHSVSWRDDGGYTMDLRRPRFAATPNARRKYIV
jgi:hypothetical protein